MKKVILVCLTIIHTVVSFAQDKPMGYAVDEGFNFWNLRQGDKAYIYVDKAYVRAYPSLQGELIDSLTVGTEMTIRSEAYQGNTVKGFYAPWFEVSYKKDNIHKKGFVWLGLMALGSHTNANGLQFIHGIERYREGTEDNLPYYNCRIKVLSAARTQIAMYNFSHLYNDQTYLESKLLSNMGLENIQDIYRVAFMGEACGISSNFYYAAWDGTQFFDMPSRYSVGDAGIFYHDEQLLFPSEHKKEKNMIYKIIEEGTVKDEEAEDPQYDISKKEERFLWNGKFFTQLIELK